ncbi:hypothetical protein F4774DRAFT_405095 [Daldinia eschscholtzii]|nr:hypothetical protein F4774DRAFT_405095 [Daldinia eschscholtzii]
MPGPHKIGVVGSDCWGVLGLVWVSVSTWTSELGQNYVPRTGTRLTPTMGILVLASEIWSLGTRLQAFRSKVPQLVVQGEAQINLAPERQMGMGSLQDPYTFDHSIGHT